MNIRNSATMKQFLLSLVATTISIILTFGTSAIIEQRQKEKAKREMVLMIIYDFDKTIEQVQKIDVALQKANQAQLEIAIHPEYFDSLHYQIMSAIPIISAEFSKTTENIFSSNIETFNTLGNVNFVHEVSSFYHIRRSCQEIVVDQFKKELSETTALQSLEDLFQVSFPMYCFTSRQCLKGLQRTRNRCMQMMKISEEELKEFSNQRLTSENKSENDDYNQMLEKLFEEEAIIDQAKEKFGIIE